MSKQNGKGSAPRPLSVSWNEFSENWDRIFGEKKDEKDKKRKNTS